MSIESTLQDEYRRRFDAAATYRDKVWQILCADFFARFVYPEHCILDLGCGWGEFSNNIKAAKKYAMDLNPDARRHLGPDVEFLQQDCSNPWPLPGGSLDVVFSSNFLEHLPDKSAITATLRHAHSALKPGGTIALLGPNVRFVPGDYWDFWDHHVPLSERSIAEALELTGFEVVQKLDRFLPYTMSDGRRAPLVLVKAYLRMPWAWRYFGKQFLVIAKKRV
ncbi:MAG TPA: class I SAM-dependent methyltransferase [Polyangiaceae bacterium]|jgi:SAM-dependent methyltransferase|nr:class I SAM-dependent methyltransferase [Polyangiaceae bacterium]